MSINPDSGGPHPHNRGPTPRQFPKSPFEWHPKHGARLIGLVARWLREMEEELGICDYLGSTADHVEDGSVNRLTMHYLLDTNACVCGDPDRALFRAYKATGTLQQCHIRLIHDVPCL